MAGKKEGAGLPLQPPKPDVVQDLKKATNEALKKAIEALSE